MAFDYKKEYKEFYMPKYSVSRPLMDMECLLSVG